MSGRAKQLTLAAIDHYHADVWEELYDVSYGGLRAEDVYVFNYVVNQLLPPYYSETPTVAMPKTMTWSPFRG